MGRARRAGLLGGMLALAVATSATAATGREWRGWPGPARTAYVAGIVDAWTGVVGVQESTGTRDAAITVFRDLVGCLRDRMLPEPHVVAVVEKYTDDNPGLLGKEMPDIVFAALTQECRR